MANPNKFFDGIIHEGIELPPFPPFVKNLKKSLEEIENFRVRKDDVLLSTYPKSGTHWLFEMLNMLTKGNNEHTVSIENHFLELVDSVSALETIQSPRIMPSHLPYQLLPEAHRKHGSKVVHLVRNPKDTHVSSYYHLEAISVNKIAWSTYIGNVIERKGQLFGGWSSFERDFEKAAEQNKNILLMYYEDVLQDPVKELRKLTMFLELERDESFLASVANRCSFANMKKVDNTDTQTDKSQKELISKMEGFENKPTVFRKGIIGDWKNKFTVSQSEKYDTVLQEDLEHYQLQCLSKLLDKEYSQHVKY